MSFLGGLTLQRGDGATPTEAFTDVGVVNSLSGLGQTNPLVDVTNWDSTAKEYIAGLPDGQEVTIEMNRLLSDTQQEGLISDVASKLNRNFQLLVTDGTSTETIEFTLTMLSWSLTPSNEEKHTMTITGKLTGAITRATA